MIVLTVLQLEVVISKLVPIHLSKISTLIAMHGDFLYYIYLSDNTTSLYFF